MKIHLSKPNLRNHLTVIILASLIILLQSSQVVGQEVEGSDSAIIVLDHEQGDFWMVDAFTGERDLIFSHDVELGQILDFVVNMDQSTIFVLEGQGCCGGLVAGDSRILRVNWHTGEVEVVLEQRNMVGLDRIPGSEQLLLTSTLQKRKASVLQPATLDRQCSVSMESYRCANPLEVSEYWGIIWLSEDKFIGRVGQPDSNWDNQYLVDLENTNRVRLPFNSDSWIQVPFENEIIGFAGNNPVTFSTINLETLESRSIVLQPQNEATRVNIWSFSPGGEFLAFRQDDSLRIVRFPEGEIVATLPSRFANAPLWIDKENFVYVHAETPASYPGELRRYNVILNEGYFIMTLDD